jgi:hypothetical protein
MWKRKCAGSARNAHSATLRASPTVAVSSDTANLESRDGNLLIFFWREASRAEPLAQSLRCRHRKSASCTVSTARGVGRNGVEVNGIEASSVAANSVEVKF